MFSIRHAHEICFICPFSVMILICFKHTIFLVLYTFYFGVIKLSLSARFVFIPCSILTAFSCSFILCYALAWELEKKEEAVGASKNIMLNLKDQHIVCHLRLYLLFGISGYIKSVINANLMKTFLLVCIHNDFILGNLQ